MSETPERESMEFDVVIVGAGPAGLSTAIRLKQLNEDLNVVVLEKGSEVGAHILSGAVLDPCGLDELIPDWKEKGAPLHTPVTDDRFYVLGEESDMRLPNFAMPKLMNNHGNYIVSMGNVCRWMAEQAEGLGVEVFPGFAASELIYDGKGAVKGVVAGEMGLAKDGTPGPQYEPGMELLGKYVVIAEGVRGSLAKQLISKFDLDKDSEPQKYGIGMKELWEVDPKHHKPGLVMHSMGWPLGGNAGGGSFVYHLENNQVYVGFVVHLNYKNPHLFPYMEFQRFKHHDIVRPMLEGGKRIAYGARAIVEGGWQSLPKMSFPGGLIVGCSAGLVNVPRIKGNHNAMISGKLAAEEIAVAIENGRQSDDLIEFKKTVDESAIKKDLYPVRNVKAMWSKYGLVGGLALGGASMWMNAIFGRSFGTMSHGKSDAESTEPASQHKVIEYPRPDGKISFDRLENVAYSFTNHDENEPAHLKLKDESIPVEVNLAKYAGPSARYCPAGVYEFVKDDAGADKFQINYQNCVHCKTCDIKDPSQNITWTTPQGGEGPNYPNM